MKISDIPTVFNVSVPTTSQLASLLTERSRLQYKIAMDTNQNTSHLTSKLTKLNAIIEQATGVESKHELHARLTQLKQEYALVPKNPTTQDQYDTIDDLRAEISSIETKLNSLNEQYNDPVEVARLVETVPTVMDEVINLISEAVNDYTTFPTMLNSTRVKHLISQLSDVK